MSHTKAGYGPTAPKFPYYDVPASDAGMYDGRPTRGNGARSPRKPVKLRSNSHVAIAGQPSSATSNESRVRRMSGTRRNTMANRRNGGGGMYDTSVMREGMMG